MEQSEHEEEQKCIECAVVMVQCERDEEHKKAQARLLMLAVWPTPLLVTNLCVNMYM